MAALQLKVEAGVGPHLKTADRRWAGLFAAGGYAALFLVLMMLAAGAPRAHAKALPSVATGGASNAGDAFHAPAGVDSEARHAFVFDKPGPTSSRSRALLASVDARSPVAGSTRPRRGVSEVKPKSVTGSTQRLAASVSSRPADQPGGRKASAPPDIVDGPRPGQAGYVHFFLLETPDGDDEIQVGIELDDGRIAWSFPETGASVMPFIRSGSIQVAGRTYEVQHLYGLRPFPDPESMAALRAALWNRVSPLVENKTPYCNPFLRSESLCLSCLGFVQAALFPGRAPGSPAMPADFPRTRSRLYYTTDDLLLYLTGFHEIATAEERARRIEELTLPSYLKEELWQLVEAVDLKDAAGGIDTSKLKNASDKPAAGRRYTRTPPQRKRL